ncbi:type II toxin-antitoxin system HipA family toxin [Undibacterium sp.]|uniref:type II toxin-antitoxin system HipA family toxin n=1 Tax=Undibacterium sp. TaxID=1914977 RepID=UPI00374D17EB
MGNELNPRYLEVWLRDLHVGWLCEAGRTTRFVATEPYIADARRPTLSMSLTVPGSDRLTREILQNPFDPALYQERGELPAYFAGLLPEGDLRKRLAATRKDIHDTDDFGILAAAGLDLPGAVKVLPADLDKLTDHARAVGVTGGSDNLEIGVPEQAAEGAASLSGMQDKLALSTAHKGKRYTLPIKGRLSDVIAKLPTRNDDAQIFNEYTAMQLARIAGVNIAPCSTRPMTDIELPDLVQALGEDKHFLAVDRFDRTPDGAVHVEDACQLQTLMPVRKYADTRYFVALLKILDRLSVRGVEDIRQFFIRQTVNTLLGNSDAHLKNFSVIYHNGLLPELSPAYDIVCVSALPGFAGFATNVAIDAQQQQQTLQTYMDIATQAGIAARIAAAAVKDTVELARTRWPDALQDLPAPPAVDAEIRRRLAVLPLTQ